MPPSSQRDYTELDLQLSLGPSLTALKGWGAPELETAYNRAQVLCENIDDSSKLIPVLWLLSTFRIGRSEHAEVDRLVARLVKLAQKTNDPALLTIAFIQVSPFYQGRFSEARRLLERAAAVQDIKQQRYIAHRFGFAPAAIALTYLSNCLWIMGCPEQADHANQQAIKIAEAVNHPMTTCYVICRACWIGAMKGDLNQVQVHVDQLYQLASKYGFKNFEYAAIFFKNWLKFMHQKDAAQPLQEMHEVMEAYYATKTVLNRTAFLVLFALVCLETGDRKRGLERVSESIHLGEKTGELWFQSEAWRTKGELLLMTEGDHQPHDQDRIDAKTCFSTAYQIAGEQGAKTFELRAVISLARLLIAEGQLDKAKHILGDTLAGFNEDTPMAEFQEARNLMESLL
jgi:adenylate cyclase